MGRAAETIPVDFVEHFRGYFPPAHTDTAAVLCYFNACEYKAPLANALAVVNDLRQANIPLYLIELCYGDQLGVMPEPTMRVRAQSWMFHKENLFNLVTPHIPAQYTKLVYLDSDVRFNCADWLDRASRVLDRCDLMQPMDWCYWSESYNRQAMAVRVSRRLACDPMQAHPGFALGVRREWLAKLGGFFELAMTGSGDACMWHAIGSALKDNSGWQTCGYPGHESERWLNKCPGFAKYVEHAKAHPARVGFTMACSMGHMPHGTHKNRQYYDRVDKMMHAGIETTRNSDGVLELVHEQDRQIIADYFKSRRDDDNDD